MHEVFTIFLKNGLALFTTKRMPKSTKELREELPLRLQTVNILNFKVSNKNI